MTKSLESRVSELEADVSDYSDEAVVACNRYGEVMKRLDEIEDRLKAVENGSRNDKWPPDPVPTTTGSTNSVFTEPKKEGA